VYVPTMGFNLK